MNAQANIQREEEREKEGREGEKEKEVREEERGGEGENTCIDENLSWLINSNYKFVDIITGIKKNHNLIKTLATI